ncbi:MAG TPA: hypothetical protein PLR24_11095 [Saprospiraceae bacterium]|nr:hypothetical protein [Saprospiraceae bacterium]
MVFTEKMIEKVFDREVDSDEEPMDVLSAIAGDQPALIAYLNQENLQLLTEEEFDYGTFLTTIIYKVFKENGAEVAEVTAAQIDMAEEANWDILSRATGKKFSQRIDVFFENYAQEDLLAFVEDALVPDELPIVTSEGREPLFVTLKTIIDVLNANIKA